jgi:N-methylhydantoinase B
MRVSDGAAWAECRCGACLGAAEDWKRGAGRRVLSAAELPDGIRLHCDLELAEFVCPGCGSLLSVEVCERGREPVADLRLLG